MVEVSRVRDVEETYTVLEKRRGKRPKITWVKEVVQEAYEEREPVIVSRKVPHRVKRVREAGDVKQVQVATTKVVPVEAYRIDEVQGIKIMEVEEWEDVELVEQTLGRRPAVGPGQNIIEREREIQLNPEARRVGVRIYPSDALELQGLVEDQGVFDNSIVGLHQSITEYDFHQFSHGPEISLGPLEFVDLEIGENEHFKIHNRSLEIIPLVGWTVYEEAGGNTYRFPQDSKLGPGETVVVWSGPRAGQQRGGFVWTTRQIWSNAGDRAVLRNARNEIMHSMTLTGDFRDINDSVAAGAQEQYSFHTTRRSSLQRR